MITEAEFKQFVDAMAVADFAKITDAEETWLRDMQFQGFDAEKVVKAFLIRCKEGKAKVGLDEIGMFKKIAYYYLTRGASVSDAVLKKMKKEEGEMMMKIVNCLSLVRDDRPQKADDLTVARLVACFPHRVAEIIAALHGTGGIRIVAYDDLTDDLKKVIKPWMCFPQAAALFARKGVNADQDKLYSSWLLWLDAFSKIVETRAEKKDKMPKKVQPPSFYADIARKQAPMTDITRMALQDKLNNIKPYVLAKPL